MFTIDLKNRTAVITGGGRGLMRETALVLAECGANVVVGDILEEAAWETASEAEKLGVRALARKVDVTSLQEMTELYEAAVGLSGKLDIAVNGAGLTYPKNFEQAVDEEVDHLIAVNVRGVDYGSRLAFRIMKEQGYGRVVNIASVAGRAANVGLPHYAMTKAAVINLTQSWALTAAKHGVAFNSVCPGIIRTNMWEKSLDGFAGSDSEAREAYWDRVVNRLIPMKIPQEPRDIANAVAFLVSDQARYITGQALNVDGGQCMN